MAFASSLSCTRRILFAAVRLALSCALFGARCDVRQIGSSSWGRSTPWQHMTVVCHEGFRYIDSVMKCSGNYHHVYMHLSIADARRGNHVRVGEKNDRKLGERSRRFVHDS